MRGFIKTILILTVTVCVLTCIAVILGATYLSRYKNSRVADELLEIGSGMGETEFYRFEARNRGKSITSAVRIEDAHLDTGIRYRFVSYEEMPENLINAFVAVEDKRFFEHDGIDFLRTAKAAANYIFGTGSFGGSGITQQLVKNLTGNDEFSIDRKLTEAFAAMDLEKRYHKTEILQMYLNIINLSEGCRGVGAAAEYFYSKAPKELTLSECATIAAITNNPARYDPQRHPENNRRRRDLILKCMFEQGYITESEYASATAEPIALNLSSQKATGINSWYIDTVTEDVITDLCKKYGISRSSASLMLYRGGLRIYTAMDANVQTVLDGYYSDKYNFPIDGEGNMPQSAMIVIDPFTGDILGVAGAVGEKKGNRLQNYATQVKRPPGSAIKPLSVYAPAVDRGLVTWSTVIEDSPVIEAQEGKKAWPSNVTNDYVGNVDIRYALEHSLNTVAVKVLDLVGAEESFRFLKDKLLIKNLDEEKDHGAAALALGQPTYGLTLREMTAAYSIFEEGIMSKPRSYYLVTDSEGRILLSNAPEQEAVLSRESAAIMTKLLEAVVDTGTASGKITLDSKVTTAGKSGTSQNNCDRYFVGYTPELLAGVWFGYDYPKDLSVFGGNVSVYIWDDVMTRIYEQTGYGGVRDFSVPETVQKLTYPSITAKTGRGTEEGWFKTNTEERSGIYCDTP